MYSHLQMGRWVFLFVLGVAVNANLAIRGFGDGRSLQSIRSRSSVLGQVQRPSLRLSGGGAAKRKVIDEFSHDINSRHEGKGGVINVEVSKLPGKLVECKLTTTVSDQLWLHWGFASRRSGWTAPPEEFLPEGTKRVDDKAVQTPFKDKQLVILVPEKQAPEALAFVLKRTGPEGEEWFNGPSGDFWIGFKPVDHEAVGDLIVEREANASHWSILDRMRLVCEQLKPAADHPDGLAWIYTILRFHVLRLVPLSKNSNYQSKDLAHTQDGLSRTLAALYGRKVQEAAGSGSDLWMRTYGRLSLATVPRGGGNGDAIRLEILDIMRRNGIKEGHRPGIEDRFLEDWHQKLHTCCAPDDIIIAEAYISFLESGGNADAYWGYLKSHGLSWEYMCGIGGGKGSANSGLAGMRATPFFLPQLTNDIKHLRWTLMQVHGGADLDFLVIKVSQGLDDELRGILRDIQEHRHEWWIPGKVTEARRRLAGYLETPGGHRDALMLDVALESWFKVSVDKVDVRGLSGDDLTGLVELTLENVALSYGGDYWRGLRLLQRVRGRGDRWERDGARRFKAALERVGLALQAHMDGVHKQLQPKADRLGLALGSDRAYLNNFGEEVVRGMPAFALSQMLAALDPMVRKAAQLGAWEMVSAGGGAAEGEVEVLEDLAGVQGKEFASSKVLVAGRVGGNEDIPTGVVAVLTRSSTDLLSHLAIRARNQGVLLATCHDDAVFATLRAAAGRYARAAVGPGGEVVFTPMDAPSADAVPTAVKGRAAASPTAAAALERALKASAGRPAQLALTDKQFSREALGGKSNNLQALRQAGAAALPDFVRLPASAALPFGVCERALEEEANAPARARLAALEKELAAGGGADAAVDAAHLAEMRELIHGLTPPAGLREALLAACRDAGLSEPALTACGMAAEAAEAGAEDEEEDAGGGWLDAVRGVWASKWSDRAYFSRRAFGIPHSALRMAVLVQEAVESEYSFVLHTRNPVTGADELVGELVVGMGEALVGNHPGRALAFRAARSGGDVEVTRFPSKRAGLFLLGAATFFRSDSNGEDLEGFAGAGLYDSRTAPAVAGPQEREVDYAEERLLNDDAFRADLLAKLAVAGRAVEAAMGGTPQDVEGAVRGGVVYIVQTRPQV